MFGVAAVVTAEGAPVDPARPASAMDATTERKGEHFSGKNQSQ